jgi:type IV pilus assembly protein PilE
MRGYSLVELMVVLVIMSILLTIAMPAYQRYAARGHRADAVRAILTIAACLERSRAHSGYYDTAACAGAAASEHYEMRIAPAAQTRALAYLITAEPVQSGYRDRCGHLGLDQTGSKTIGGANELLARCWAGK